MLTGMLARNQFRQSVAALRFADRDVFHFRGDDAASRVMHLRDVHARLGNARLAREIEAQAGEFRIGQPFLAVTRTRPRKFHGIASRLDPGLAQRRETGTDVDAYRRIGVRP